MRRTHGRDQIGHRQQRANVGFSEQQRHVGTMVTIRTLDAHTAGEPLRLIIDGFPEPQGETMLERREWLREHHDHLRTAIMLEPRGHADMYGALLTRPERPDSDAGVLFMHNEGYSTMCGHGIIAVTTLVFERGLLNPRTAGRAGARFAGRRDPRARAIRRHGGSAGVSFTNVPSFVLHAGVPVRVNGRDMRADVAFGGAFYAIVDSEAAGIPRQRPSPRRSAAHGHGDQGSGRSGGARRASAGSGPARHLRHDLHRAALAGGCRSAQRHDLRGRGSRSIAVRNRDVRGDGRPCRDGPAWPRADVHPREHHRQPVSRVESWERRW